MGLHGNDLTNYSVAHFLLFVAGLLLARTARKVLYTTLNPKPYTAPGGLPKPCLWSHYMEVGPLAVTQKKHHDVPQRASLLYEGPRSRQDRLLE